MVDVKKRKIRKTDWEEIEEHIKKELDEREHHQFRQDHERIWREIDRQVALQPMTVVAKGTNKEDVAWRNVIELGELSKASEIISADVMRISFPQDRSWFDAHVELSQQMTPQGPVIASPDMQQRADRTLRSLMVQQQNDFGFMERVKLSVIEALQHGSFAAEVQFEQQMMVKEGEKLSKVGAPVWKPHSMWNTFPDPSPSILSSTMFYTGSMIFRSYMPRAKLKNMKGEGWMLKRFEDVPEEEHEVEGRNTKDVRLVTYYGDLSLDRNRDDIFLPNCKVILANNICVYYAPNEMPYPSVIYSGYERQDVRDPYYTSPLIKMSPWQKMGSKLASRFLDGIDLKTEPPLTYDGSDPQFIVDGGPRIAPGAKSPTKGSSAYKEIVIGDPKFALDGLGLVMKTLQEGLGVSSVRSGAVSSDRATAYEIAKTAQGGEVRTVEFIRGLTFSLRTFLYMQHELNKLHMDRYAFYNDEMNSADFMRVSKKDLPESAQFDVVGAKGLLGEEQRMNRTTAVTTFASASPVFAPLLKPVDLLIEMYRDAGQKNPERFVNAQGPQVPPEVQAHMQQSQQQMQQMSQVIQQLQQQLQQAEQKSEAKLVEEQRKMQDQLQKHALSKDEFKLKWAEAEHKAQLEISQAQADYQAKLAEFKLKVGDSMRTYEMDKATAAATESATKSEADKSATKVDRLEKVISDLSDSVVALGEKDKQETKAMKITLKGKRGTYTGQISSDGNISINGPSDYKGTIQ